MLQGQMTMQPGLGLWNQIIHTDLNKILIGLRVYDDVHEIIPQDIPDPLGKTCYHYYSS